jgi:epoxyqueuosine reductase QueG
MIYSNDQIFVIIKTMQEKIKQLIKEHVGKYQIENSTKTSWLTPLIGFANAQDRLFLKLKSVVSKDHKLPRELLVNAETVISYFIPFEKEVVSSNVGKECSEQWAVAYIETNKLISDLNDVLCNFLQNKRISSISVPATHNFDKKKLISDCTHRHIAYIAGLGKFGLNKMLITEKGCCGRFGSVITTVIINATERPEKEYCLYFHDKSCQKCLDKCTWGALKISSFDRHECYAVCLENLKKFQGLGAADVCGKCMTMVPCSFRNPIE